MEQTIIQDRIKHLQKEIENEEKMTKDRVWLHVLKGKKLAYEEMLSSFSN